MKFINLLNLLKFMAGNQHFEQRNVERPIFQNFEMSNIERTNDELFDLFNFEFIFDFIFVRIIRTPKIYHNSEN